MRKIHDVLRLHFGLKMPQRQIARSIQVSQSTVSEYLTRFEQSGLHWPLPEGFDEQQLQEKLFGPGWGKSECAAVRPLPDFEQIRHELATNRHTPCNCCGRNTGRRTSIVPTPIPASGSTMNNGAHARTW
jgi:hypothetical protein